MKRNLIIGFIAVLVVAGLVFAQTINKQIYGIATPGLYKYTLSTNTTGAYLLGVPTLSTDDTIVGLATTQTLTNKTLTIPVIASFYQDANKTILITAPSTASVTLASLTGTETLTNKTLTTPIINFGAGTHSYAGGATAWTLSAAESSYIYFKLTSANGAVDMVAPNSAGHMILIWNSTGQTVTCKKSGGSGAAVASTKKAALIHNGSDYVNALGDL
jgi:hypothetical protein